MLQSPPERPAPIRTDVSNAFAHDTMTRRVPEGIDAILANNPDYPASIQQGLLALKQTISGNAPITMLHAFAPDYAHWVDSVEARSTETWLNTQWFFAETYYYRRVIEMTRWFETGRDPFAPNKHKEYASDLPWQLLKTALEIDASPQETIGELLSLALWGNRIDLSFEASLKRGTTVREDDLIVDNVEVATTQIINGVGAVHIIVDNAGTELTMDLALADRLLTDNIVEEVILHLKMHPTFVSDAIPADVMHFIAMLDNRGGIYADVGKRLHAYVERGRLRLLPDFFWNSSQWLWEIPENMVRGFSDARLVIIKGDANYRRMVGDAVWQADTPFSTVTGYFPAPLLALRTLKSDPIAGLKTGLDAKLNGIDDAWRVNGQRGVIQFKS